MKPDNYFKVRVRRHHVSRTFAFETRGRGSVLSAFDRAIVFSAQHGGTLSVCYPVLVDGPWSSVPVIVPPATLDDSEPDPEIVEGPGLFGEAGCY